MVTDIKRYKKRSKLDVSIAALEKDLLSKIDPTDSIQKNKASHYIRLEKMLRGFFEDIEERGVMLETKNGAQEFTKHHALIDKIRPTISTQLEIEKSLNLHDEQEEKEVKRTASDLL